MSKTIHQQKPITDEERAKLFPNGPKSLKQLKREKSTLLIKGTAINGTSVLIVSGAK